MLGENSFFPEMYLFFVNKNTKAKGPCIFFLTEKHYELHKAKTKLTAMLLMLKKEWK